MASKQQINITFTGNKQCGKKTIINALLNRYIIGDNQSFSIKYNLEPALAGPVNEPKLHYINFEWGENVLFEPTIVCCDDEEALKNLHNIDYFVYIFDLDDHKNKINTDYIEKFNTEVMKNKYLTQFIYVFNKYDDEYESDVGMYTDNLIQLAKKYNLKEPKIFRIDARKVMIFNHIMSHDDTSIIPPQILHGFYNEYFGKLITKDLINKNIDEIKEYLSSKIKFSESEFNFLCYIKSLPNNKDYYQEKCAMVTKHIIEYISENHEKNFEEYIDNIGKIISENNDIFNENNISKIYINAFTKYYDINTTKFDHNINFVETVFNIILKNLDKIEESKRIPITKNFFNRTLNKIISFNDPKNENIISLIKFIRDKEYYYIGFMNSYLPLCMEYSFYSYIEKNPDDTSDDEDGEDEADEANEANRINNNEQFMFILNFMINNLSYLENRNSFNVFLFKRVLNQIPYQSECILKTIRSIYQYSDQIYYSLVDRYYDNHDCLMKLKFNYTTKVIKVDYEYIMNNSILKLIAKLNTLFATYECKKDFIFPQELIK
jgi:hypothetical protein